MVSLNRLLLAPEGTHLDSSFNFYCTHTSSRIASTLAGADRRKAEVETIKERRGSQAGGLHHPLPLNPQSCCTSGCSHPDSHRFPLPLRSDGLFIGLIFPMNSPPKRADKHVLFRLECPGLLFGIKGVPLGAQRCGLGAQQHAIDSRVQLDDQVLIHQSSQVLAK